MSTVWEGTNVCENQYMCALAIYLMTVLPYLYEIMMDRAINAPGHGMNFCRINATDKLYLKR